MKLNFFQTCFQKFSDYHSLRDHDCQIDEFDFESSSNSVDEMKEEFDASNEHDWTDFNDESNSNHISTKFETDFNIVSTKSIPHRVKPTCNICGKAFARKQGLYKHKKFVRCQLDSLTIATNGSVQNNENETDTDSSRLDFGLESQSGESRLETNGTVENGD